MKDFRMSKKELDQVLILDSILKGELTQNEGSVLLNLSTRQVRRKLKRYQKAGIPGLVHESRGKPGNRRTPTEIVEKAIHLIKTLYKDWGPTFVAQKFAKKHDIHIDHETLRRIMIREQLRSEKKKKTKKVYTWRERKWCFGELLQADGSYHDWFSTGEYCTLIAFIDDATSNVELLFADHETYNSLIDITLAYIKKYGFPRAIYVDCGKVYRVNNGTDRKNRKTQYQRMLAEVDIEVIHAYSPQAKGRVERLFGTLQDRLAKELVLNKIKTIDDANKFLKAGFIEEFNQQFSVEPTKDIDLHRSIEGYKLNSIFCIKKNRILKNDRTINYEGRWFALGKDQPIRLYPRSIITVCTYRDGTISLMANDHRLKYSEINKPKKRVQEATDPYKTDRRTLGNKPPQNHPWRKSGKRV